MQSRSVRRRFRRCRIAWSTPLGRLHATDPEAVGLEDFGRPEGFLERQIRRWTKQLKSSQSREVPGIDDLAAKLAARIPETQRTAIVHGDYRLDNVIVGRNGQNEYDVAAVVDWEMSTLGDPSPTSGSSVRIGPRWGRTR